MKCVFSKLSELLHVHVLHVLTCTQISSSNKIENILNWYNWCNFYPILFSPFSSMLYTSTKIFNTQCKINNNFILKKMPTPWIPMKNVNWNFEEYFLQKKKLLNLSCSFLTWHGHFHLKNPSRKEVWIKE